MRYRKFGKRPRRYMDSKIFKNNNGAYPDIFEYATGMHSWPYQRTYKWENTPTLTSGLSLGDNPND